MGKHRDHLSDDEIALVKESSLLVGRTLAEVARHIAPGMTTGALDAMAEEFIRDNGRCARLQRLVRLPKHTC
jgi:methionine aminopeptidase